MLVQKLSPRCAIHLRHVVGRQINCGGERMRRVKLRSRILKGTYLVNSVGDVFRVVAINKKANTIGLVNAEYIDGLVDEVPTIYRNRFSALVTAGYEYTNSVVEKALLLAKE